jgi:hypothetical protein
VVTRPAELLSVRFDPPDLGSSISARAAEESAKDAGALPLLSYLLEDMWSEMVRRGDGVLRLSGTVIDLGAVLVDRADAFLTSHSESEETVRRIFTLRLATVREDGEPIRRCAMRSEFTDDEWLLVSDLADHPNRLLVTGKSQAGEAYAEVAHETIFKHWPDDGSAWTTPDCHSAAARGGSWAHDSESLRSSSRNDYWPEFRAPFIGFRVARTLSTDSCGAPGC